MRNEDTQFPLGDDELILDILKGNSARYAEIVERYQIPIYRTAYYYSQNAEDARDITQEVFIKAYNNLDGFKHSASFSTWLYRIAVNHCLDWCRRKKSRWVDTDSLTNVPSEEDSPEEQILRQEKAGELQEVIGKLPEIYRTILILYYFEDISPPQIAAILGIAKRTVETRLFRARKILREKIPGDLRRLSGEKLAGSI